jgi:hypothetical protein
MAQPLPPFVEQQLLRFRDIPASSKQARSDGQLAKPKPCQKNSNFSLDHNSEDRWQPRCKIP